MPGSEEAKDLSAHTKHRLDRTGQVRLTYLLARERRRWLPADLRHPPLPDVDLLLCIEHRRFRGRRQICREDSDCGFGLDNEETTYQA